MLSLVSRSPSRFEIGRLGCLRVAGVQRMPGYADESVMNFCRDSLHMFKKIKET